MRPSFNRLFSSSTVKQPKAYYQSQPYLNYLDPTEKEFLTQKYVRTIQRVIVKQLDMIQLFRKRQGEEIKEQVCDHKDINKYLKELAEDTMNTDQESKELALVGRSNVGKSSLLNTLLSGKPKSQSKTAKDRIQQGNLALTSKTPGKTNHIHFFRLPIH